MTPQMLWRGHSSGRGLPKTGISNNMPSSLRHYILIKKYWVTDLDVIFKVTGNRGIIMLFATTGWCGCNRNYSAVLGCQVQQVKFHVPSKVSQIRWEGVLSALSTWFRVGDGHQSGQDRQDLESSSHPESLPYSRWREIYIY